MPKIVGIEIGRHEVVAVEVEGSPRRFKVTGIGVLPLAEMHLEEGAEAPPKADLPAPADPKAPVPPPTGPESHEAAASRGEASADLTRAVSSLFKRFHLSRENTALAFPGRLAVVRNMTLPFKGLEAIRKVIKFESESQFHTRSAEDMVVDFHVVRETDTATELLVFAVPKPTLKGQLLSLARAGVEPEVVDIDTMTLFRCAEALGILDTNPKSATPKGNGGKGDGAKGGGKKDKDKDKKGVEASEDAASGAPAPSADTYVLLEDEEARSAPPAVPTDADNKAAAALVSGSVNQLLLSITESSTEALVVRSGNLVAARNIRLGIESIGEAIARAYSLTREQGRQALGVCLEGAEQGPMTPIGKAAAAPAESAAEGAPPPTLPSVLVDEKLIRQECLRFCQRLVRELVRFLSGVHVPDGMHKIWLTGVGARVPGINEAFSAALGAPTQDFLPLDHVEHDLTDEEKNLGEHTIAAALGAALRQLGAVRGMDFRQEDLTFSRKFDRIKFPLALASMFVMFFMLTVCLYLHYQVFRIEEQLGRPQAVDAKASKTAKPTIKFGGFVGGVVNRQEASSGSLVSRALGPGVPTAAEERRFDQLREQLAAAPADERLELALSEMQAYFKELAGKRGYSSEAKLESGFGVLVRWAEVIEKVKDQLGQFLVMDVKLQLPPQKNLRKFEFKVFFRGTEFRSQNDVLRNAFHDDCRDPQSPFEKLDDQSSEMPEDGGTSFRFNLTLRENQRVYQPKKT
jgi:Tfp pilus assembly PilM family ATPase